MKHKRLIILAVLMLFISIGVFSIYKSTYQEELNYVVLGDSLAAGRNPYGSDDYGYTDYVRDYLKQKGRLNDYISYAVSGYTIDNISDDINYNKTIEIDGQNVSIRKALRESDLVTISIGANDFLAGMSISSLPTIFSDRTAVTSQVDTILEEIDDLLTLIKKYAKGKIIIVGYYNPLPSLTKYKDNINEVIEYADSEYENLCINQDVYYVKISDILASDDEYLPNPLDIHPNKFGYEAISKEVINAIETEVFK